jgi:hypothetical protein
VSEKVATERFVRDDATLPTAIPIFAHNALKSVVNYLSPIFCTNQKNHVKRKRSAPALTASPFLGEACFEFVMNIISENTFLIRFAGFTPS